MSAIRKTPPPEPDPEVIARFVRQLSSVAHIKSIPRLFIGWRRPIFFLPPEPHIRWSQVVVSPAFRKTRDSTTHTRYRLWRGTYSKAPTGGEIHAGYDYMRAFAKHIEYNNRSSHWGYDPSKQVWVRKGRNPMAKVILPALSSLASGKVGDIVFMRRGGANIARIRVKPSNPNSPAQQVTRGNLSGLATAWKQAGSTGSVSLVKAPSTPVSFNYLTLAEKHTWPSFQAFVGQNVSRLSAGDNPIRTP